MLVTSLVSHNALGHVSWATCPTPKQRQQDSTCAGEVIELYSHDRLVGSTIYIFENSCQSHARIPRATGKVQLAYIELCIFCTLHKSQLLDAGPRTAGSPGRSKASSVGNGISKDAFVLESSGLHDISSQLRPCSALYPCRDSLQEGSMHAHQITAPVNQIDSKVHFLASL